MWVDNRDDVMRAADILTENGIFIEAGPSKHNNSQGFYLYSYEPGGDVVFAFDADSEKIALLRTTGEASLCAQTESMPYKYVTLGDTLEWEAWQTFS